MTLDMKGRAQLHTCAINSISFKAFPTCAVEAAIVVSAGGIGMACMCPHFTLINICKNWRKLHKYHIFPVHTQVLMCRQMVQ